MVTAACMSSSGLQGKYLTTIKNFIICIDLQISFKPAIAYIPCYALGFIPC